MKHGPLKGGFIANVENIEGYVGISRFNKIGRLLG